MGCNCKKPKNVQAELKPEPVQQEIRVPQSVDELHSMLMNKHAEELANQFRNGNNNISDQETE
jgi:hypothetical protein